MAPTELPRVPAGHASSPLARRIQCVVKSSIARHRAAVERRVGDAGRFGIREGLAVTLIGGSGFIDLAGAEIDLVAVGPFVGLSRDALIEVRAVRTGEDGLLVVPIPRLENLYESLPEL